MRITGGTLRGRTVEAHGGSEGIRPAMDRMRESVFAVLGDLSGLSFLDLFSGSGVIALEAASRGAFPLACVEKDAGKRRNILANLSISPRRIECHIVPVELFIKRSKEAFDMVFCDPPFPYRFRSELLLSLSERPVLKPGGLLLLHYPCEDATRERVGRLTRIDQRSYGRSYVDFYRKDEEKT
jgi:16S rRNA (guanine966-N2)-methyltransferase